jgi:hypothetical protein
MPRRSSWDAHGHAAESASDDGDLESLGQFRLALGPLGGPRELLESREAAPGLELQVTHLFGCGHVHEGPKLGPRGLWQRHRPGMLLQPRHGLVDEKLTLSIGEVGRGWQLSEVGILRLLVQRHPYGIQVGDLDSVPDERRVRWCLHGCSSLSHLCGTSILGNLDACNFCVTPKTTPNNHQAAVTVPGRARCEE